MINFDTNIFEAASSREWLEANGIGGFASGTISGANTRRYHGILTAAMRPPLGRLTLVSKVEETAVIDGNEFELSANQYPGLVHPRGFEYLVGFRLDPFPIWTYKVGALEIEKRVFMVHGSNATVVRYGVMGATESDFLKVRPMLAYTDYHHLQHERDDIDPEFTVGDGAVEIQPFAHMPKLFTSHNGTDVEKMGHWYRNLEYSIEKERGFEFREDLFQPFEIAFDLKRPASLIFSTERGFVSGDVPTLERQEIERRRHLIKMAGARTNFERQLVLAADQFIVKRGEGHTVIAGYPWFSDWGRDTMIALPGLTLTTKRPEIAKGILFEFAKYVSEGMIPNRFPDAGEKPEYNTVDATLWYFEAVRSYIKATADYESIREALYTKLAEILAWHLRGTRYNIHVDTDGLLYAGSPEHQLTWMDAKIGDLVVTPRTGKAVEIQALWYNALCIMADLAERFGDDEDRAKYIAMADLAKQSFNAAFWNESAECLYDVVENGTRDASVRPNQIFAASLHHSMLDNERAEKVVDKVEAELLTPCGLRSLSPRDPKYVGIYTGSPLDRDSAYHQGTVWAWLIGGFVDAYRRVYPERTARVDEILRSFEQHLTEAGVGQISEIFDGDAPHAPRGCPAQAWSVAEVLRSIRM